MTLPAAVPAKGLAARPALVAGLRVGYWRNIEGTVEELPLAAAAERARRSPPLLCHLPATARRLRSRSSGAKSAGYSPIFCCRA